nr:hypothetical protein [Reyranella sp. CPCC 100927]
MLLDAAGDVDTAFAALGTGAAAAVDFANGAAAPADGVADGTFVYGIADADVHDHLDAAAGRTTPKLPP